jgi:hypothetical protein
MDDKVTIATLAMGSFLCACSGGGSGATDTTTRFLPAVAYALNSAGSWSNGQQVPASFLNSAFGATGPLYQQLSATPQLAANSAAVISYYFSGYAPFTPGWIDGNSAQAQYDYNAPIYQASASDSRVQIVCNNTSACADNGLHIYMPISARQAGGTDHQLAVIEPNSIEYDFWLVSSQPPYGNGSTFNASGEAHFALNGTGGVAPGFAKGAATAGGIAVSIAQMYTSELNAGVINHALALTFPCGTNAWVYPASQLSGVCGGGQGMPLGSRVWWAPPDAQTMGMGLPRDMTTVLSALHHYGGFYIDSFGGVSNGQGQGMGARLESQEAYWTYGNGVDPALNYAANASGWSHSQNSGVDRYVLAGSGVSADILDNLKVLAPCVTQKTC